MKKIFLLFFFIAAFFAITDIKGSVVANILKVKKGSIQKRVVGIQILQSEKSHYTGELLDGDGHDY